MRRLEELQADVAVGLSRRTLRADAAPMVEALAELVRSAAAVSARARELQEMARQLEPHEPLTARELGELSVQLRELGEHVTGAERESEAVLRRFRVLS